RERQPDSDIAEARPSRRGMAKDVPGRAGHWQASVRRRSDADRLAAGQESGLAERGCRRFLHASGGGEGRLIRPAGRERISGAGTAEGNVGLTVSEKVSSGEATGRELAVAIVEQKLSLERAPPTHLARRSVQAAPESGRGRGRRTGRWPGRCSGRAS